MFLLQARQRPAGRVLFLANGTRLTVKRLQDHVLECIIMTGGRGRTNTFVFIPGAQGQSLRQVGVFLPKPVFTHGQLYVALTRDSHLDHLKALNMSKNVPFDFIDVRCRIPTAPCRRPLTPPLPSMLCLLSTLLLAPSGLLA